MVKIIVVDTFPPELVRVEAQLLEQFFEERRILLIPHIEANLQIIDAGINLRFRMGVLLDPPRPSAASVTPALTGLSASEQSRSFTSFCFEVSFRGFFKALPNRHVENIPMFGFLS